MSDIWDEKKMRLKFLFFPIILVVSAAIFIGYIWPAIGEVRKINESKFAKNSELQLIKEKQVAIESIGKKISDNVEGESVVNNYLPENKVEERIISGINYLAGDANVSLVNISLGNAENEIAPLDTAIPNSPIGATLAGIANPIITSIDPLTGQAISNNASLMQAVAVRISLIGDYSKIRIFIDSLQRMPIFNTIRSVDITKQKKEAEEVGVSDLAAGSAASDSALAAVIEVDFGYLDVAKVENRQVENFKVGLDNETIDSLKKYISQKSQPVGGDNDAKGKTNPFLAN